jgi:hypothetical protein
MPELTQQMLERLDNDFTYHAPIEGQPQRYGDLREAGKTLARTVVEETPPSREQSLALTKIDEAIFWANAAIARNEKTGGVDCDKQ